jgi:hypothetical protein
MSIYPLDDSTGAALNGLAGAVHTTFGRGTGSQRPGVVRDHWYRGDPLGGVPNWHSKYRMMRALAMNQNPYRGILDILRQYGLEGVPMHGLRNPTNAIASFYRSTTWPGPIMEHDEDASALPIRMPAVDEDDPELRDLLLEQQDNLRKAIHRVWRWSNLQALKDTAAYDCAVLGDQFLKVVTDRASRRVWFEFITPEHVTDLRTDGRDYLVYIRLDVPQEVTREDGSTHAYMYTEVWDKAARTLRVWEHDNATAVGLGARPLESLGPPLREWDDYPRALGFDFVPFVAWKFTQSSDDDRGIGCIERALDKVLYMDADATALHQRLSRYGLPDMALKSNAYDRDGNPLPPVSMAEGITTTGGAEDGEMVVWTLPNGTEVEFLIPDLPYDDHLAVINAHFDALAEGDLCELSWYRVSADGAAAESGRALEYRMVPARARAMEVRSRGESALVAATVMCLSIGQSMGLPGFKVSEIGTYANDDLVFWIGPRPVVPMGRLDEMEYEQARATAVQTYASAGAHIAGAATVVGLDPEQVEVLVRGDVLQEDEDDAALDEAAAAPPAVPAAPAPTGPAGPARLTVPRAPVAGGE